MATPSKFNISAIKVTHSYYYCSAQYLLYCKDSGIEPTERGFYDYVLPEINSDFPLSDSHPYETVEFS